MLAYLSNDSVLTMALEVLLRALIKIIFSWSCSISRDVQHDILGQEYVEPELNDAFHD